MTREAGLVTVGEGMKAVAFALDMPVTDLSGYIVVGMKTNGDYEIVGNFLSPVHVAAILADVVAQQLGKLAHDATPDVIT